MLTSPTYKVSSWIKEYWIRSSEACWLCWSPHLTCFFLQKSRVLYTAQLYDIYNYSIMIFSYQNKFILPSSSWKTLVSVTYLDGYQHSIAKEERLYSCTWPPAHTDWEPLTLFSAEHHPPQTASTDFEHHLGYWKHILYIHKAQHHFSTVNHHNLQPRHD